MKNSLFPIWMVILVASCPYLSAQFVPENFEIIPFSTSPSGTQSYINTLLEDPQGYIWIGTFDGLYRYDGFNFKAFVPPDDSHGQEGLMIGKLFVKKDHLYAASNRGLQIVHLPSFTITTKNFAEDGNAAANLIHDIQEDVNGSLWVNTRIALHQLSYPFETLQTIPLPDTLVSPGKMAHYVNLIVLQNGHIWFEGYRNQGRATYLDYKQEEHQFTFLDLDPKNRWQLTRQISPNLIFYARDSEPPEVGSIDPEDGSSNRINHLSDSLSDELVVTLSPWDSNHILASFNQKKILLNFTNQQLIDPKLPLFLTDPYSEQNLIYGLFKTGQGITLGFCSQGLIRFIDEANVFKKYLDLDEQFTQRDETSLVEIFKDGPNIWALHHGDGGVIQSSEGMVIDRIHFDRDNLNPLWDYWWNISKVNQDTFWIGTSGGLHWYTPATQKMGRVKRSNLPEAVHRYAITTQFEDSRGELWMGIGAGYGMLRWSADRKSFKYYPNASGGLPFRYPKAIAEDAQGDLWMGCQTGGGLVRWERSRDSFHVIRPSLNAVFSNDLIDAIAISDEGKIYFGGGGGGIYEYDRHHRSFRNWSQAEGLSNQYILDLCWDRNGDLWIGTRNGLNRLDVSNDNMASFYMKHGLPSNHIELIQFATDSTLFISTPAGTRRFNPDRLEKSTNHQPVRITELRINNENCNHRLGELNDLKLGYRQNNLTFEISQVNLIDGELNKYQFRIEGRQHEWTPLNAGNHLQLLSLSPGRYQLQFRVCFNNTCQMTDQVAILIRPPFWRSPFFYLLVAATFVGLVMGYNQLQMRSMIKRQNLRNQISADLHDDIGSSLSSIGFMTEMMTKEDMSDPESHQRLESIKEEIGLISQNLEEIIWHIKPTTDSLQEIHLKLRRFSTELLESKDIKLIWDQANIIDTALNSNQKRDYFLIFKEIINNAAKHSQATQVRVYIEGEGDFMRLEVTDDGIGFNPGQDFDSNGLNTLHFRAKRLGGVLEIKSRLGMGSRITLRFALN